MLVCYSFKLKYLNKNVFLSNIEKTQFFSYEHKVLRNILKEFSALLLFT